jgi:hypothetical protein
MANFKIPINIENLIDRLKVKATEDGYTSIVTQLTNVKPVLWFNLPGKLNQLMTVIKNYQLLLLDGDVQDLIDEIGVIYWFNIFNKVANIKLLVETIEAI